MAQSQYLAHAFGFHPIASFQRWVRNNREIDLTVGKALPLLIKFSIPMLVSFLVQQTYVLADRAIVGKFCGPAAMAALSCTGGLQFMLMGFLNGHCTGLAVITAQKVGAKEPENVRRSVAHSLVAMLVAAVALMAVSMLCMPWFLKILHVPANVFDDAYTYIMILFGGTVAMGFSNVVACLLRAVGDSITPMLILMFSALANILLNLLFVCGFGWGVPGVGIATVTVAFASGALSWHLGVKHHPEYLKLKMHDLRMSWAFMWEHLKTSVPMGLQFSITGIGAVVNSSAVNTLGSDAIAIIGVAGSMEFFFWAPFIVVGGSLATYAAQNYGAKRLDRIRQGARDSMWLLMGWSLVCALCFLVGDRFFASLFLRGDDITPEMLHNLSTYLRVAIPFIIPLAAIHVYRNILQGMGHAIVPLMGGVWELVARAGSAFPLLHAWGFLGISFVNPLAWLAAGVWLAICFPILIRRDARSERFAAQ